MTDKRALTDEEVAKLRDAAIRRALNTPPTPTSQIKGKPRMNKDAASKTASSRSKPKASGGE